MGQIERMINATSLSDEAQFAVANVRSCVQMTARRAEHSRRRAIKAVLSADT